MSSISLANVIRDFSVIDFRKKTFDGGPSMGLRLRPWWFGRGKKMYSSAGGYTGTPWQPYAMQRGRELRYVAIKASIYRRRGRRFSKKADLLRWMSDGERLYPSLTNKSDPRAIYRVNRKSINAGTSLPYAQRLGTTGSIPAKLGGGVYPGRKLLGIEGAAARDMNKIVKKWYTAQNKGIQKRSDRAGKL